MLEVVHFACERLFLPVYHWSLAAFSQNSGKNADIRKINRLYLSLNHLIFYLIFNLFYKNNNNMTFNARLCLGHK